MSMLAERKHKVKWTLNPRGNTWAKDDNKFGQKLMEKMGWQKGKGLGKMEDGQVEHIKVTYKNDTTGVGWDDNLFGWVSRQQAYDKLLSKLKKTSNNNNSVSQIQKPTADQNGKGFSGRVRYPKLLRDVNQYSKDDVDSVMGTKLFSNTNDKESGSNKKETETHEKAPVSTEEDFSDFHGVKTFKSGATISDYFAQKLKSKKSEALAKSNVSCEDEVVEINENRDEEDTSSLPIETATNSPAKKRKHSETEEVISNANEEETLTKAAKKSKLPKQQKRDNSKCNQNLDLDPKGCLKNENKREDTSKKSVTFHEQSDSVSPSAETVTTATKSSDGPKLSDGNTDSKKDLVSAPKKVFKDLSKWPDPMWGPNSVKNSHSWFSVCQEAGQMSQYARIVENIMQHDVLSTTNLADIRGYGN